MYKPRIPEDTTAALMRKRLHDKGDLKAHAAPDPKRKPQQGETVEEFLARGGKIQQVPATASGYEAQTNSNSR